MNRLSRLEGLLVRAGGKLLSRTANNASLLVMIYHRVLREADPLLPGEPDAETFSAQMDLVATHFNPLPLATAIKQLREGSLPARAICITFDDGYANNCEVALPILAARSIPATVFVAPSYLNGGLMFNDIVIETIRRASGELDLREEGLNVFQLSDMRSRMRATEAIVMALKYLQPEERLRRAKSIAERVGAEVPTDLMMTDDQVRKMANGGIEIGAHTMSHPILKSVDDRVARDEIFGSKRMLEEIVGAPVSTFAYPNGKPNQDYGRAHVELVKEAGFSCAFTTAWGAPTRTSDVFQIPRVAPWDAHASRYAARLVGAYADRKFQTATG
jgi:peptidoglycan/xylan/chitin deacetylase (PgdA/CDA1 family)